MTLLTFRHPGQEAIDPDFRRRLEALGMPLAITSGYRSPKYNASVDGAPRSRHMHRDAVDIDLSGMSEQEREALVLGLHAQGVPRFGTYSKSSNMLHVDMSPMNGPAWFMHDRTADNISRAPAWLRRARAKILRNQPQSQPRSQPQSQPVQVPTMSTPFSLPPGMGIDLSPIEEDPPTFTAQLATNPLLMMGLGILGAQGGNTMQNIGAGAQQGLLAALGAESASKKNQMARMKMEQTRRWQQLQNWSQMQNQAQMMGMEQMNPFEREQVRQMRWRRQQAALQDQYDRYDHGWAENTAGRRIPLVRDKSTGAYHSVGPEGIGDPVDLSGGNWEWQPGKRSRKEVTGTKTGGTGLTAKERKEVDKLNDALMQLNILRGKAIGPAGAFTGTEGVLGRTKTGFMNMVNRIRQPKDLSEQSAEAYEREKRATLGVFSQMFGLTGVLSDQDILNTLEGLPKADWFPDTESMAERILDELDYKVKVKLARKTGAPLPPKPRHMLEREAYERSGYDMPQGKPIDQMTEEEIDAELREYGVTLPPSIPQLPPLPFVPKMPRLP